MVHELHSTPDVSRPVLPPSLRLDLIEPLGQGAMGTVWRARHTGLDVEVAVKIAERGRGDWRDRFLVEARAAAAVKSPHVVSVFDCGSTEDGRPYLAMELLEGETLEERLARGALPLAEVVEIVRQIAEGLRRSHEAGVIHRDLKPANVFLCRAPDLHAKILDFGIAKWGAGRTQPGTMMGTPFYMSPELVEHAHAVDARVDVWALAVLAYELATNAVPFDGSDVPSVLRAICSAAHRPIQAHLPVAPALEAVFARAFARGIDDRFADAPSFARALAAAVRADRPSARPGMGSNAGVPDAVLETPTPAEEAAPAVTTTPVARSLPPSPRERPLPYLAFAGALVAVFLSPWLEEGTVAGATAGIAPPAIEAIDAVVAPPDRGLGEARPPGGERANKPASVDAEKKATKAEPAVVPRRAPSVDPRPSAPPVEAPVRPDYGF